MLAAVILSCASRDLIWCSTEVKNSWTSCRCKYTNTQRSLNTWKKPGSGGTNKKTPMKLRYTPSGRDHWTLDSRQRLHSWIEWGGVFCATRQMRSETCWCPSMNWQKGNKKGQTDSLSLLVLKVQFKDKMSGCLFRALYLMTAALGVVLQTGSWQLMLLMKSSSVRRLCRQEFM